MVKWYMYMYMATPVSKQNRGQMYDFLTKLSTRHAQFVCVLYILIYFVCTTSLKIAGNIHE